MSKHQDGHKGKKKLTTKERKAMNHLRLMQSRESKLPSVTNVQPNEYKKAA